MSKNGSSNPGRVSDEINTNIIKGEWSNETCSRIAYQDSFPAYAKDLAVQKVITENFLNFYLGVRIKKGINATDIAFAALSIMPLHADTEQFIWDSEHFTEDGTLFFMTAEDKLKVEIDRITQKEFKKASPATTNDPYVTLNSDNNLIINPLNVNTADKANIKPSSPENKQEIPPVNNRKNDNNKEWNSTSKAREKTGVRFDKFKLPEMPQTVQWFGDKDLKGNGKKTEMELKQYGPVENAAFTSSCTKILQEWNRRENIRGRIAMKYFIGIVALTLLRGASKSYKHIVNTFASAKFLNALAFAKDYIKYSVPHKRCVKTSCRVFSKRTGNVSVMFAKIVMNSYYIDALRKDKITSSIKINVYKVTLLAHTAYYGLGLVGMVQTIANNLSGTDLGKLLRTTYCEETAGSWERLARFFNRYMTKGSSEKTHHWARLIDGEYFKDLCCSENYPLAIVLAVFVERATRESGVWQSSWVGDDEKSKRFKVLGQQMYDKFIN